MNDDVVTKGSEASVRHLLSTFVKLSIDKPSDLNQTQELVFAFLSRFALHSLTLWDVFFPHERAQLKARLNETGDFSKLMDHPGASLIVRSLYEDYLTLSYLTDPSVSSDLLHCRFLAYKLAGLLKRQKLKAFLQSDTNAESDQSDVDEVKIELKKNDAFSGLPFKTQRNWLDKGLILDGQRERIAVSAGIPSNFHNYLYKELSSYVHSDSHSFYQLEGVEQDDMIAIARNHFIFVSALMLDLTKRHLFTKEIEEIGKLNGLIKFGCSYVRDFDKINKERKK